MPKSLVNKLIRQGMTRKEAEASAARITNAQKAKKGSPPKKGKKR